MRRLLEVKGSSNVKAFAYHFVGATLDVIYHAEPRVVYRFASVRADDFCYIISAESVGNALRLTIGNVRVHPFEKYDLDSLYDANGCEKSTPNVRTSEHVPRDVVVVVPRSGDALKSAIIKTGEQPKTMTDEEAFNSVINRPKKG